MTFLDRGSTHLEVEKNLFDVGLQKKIFCVFFFFDILLLQLL